VRPGVVQGQGNKRRRLTAAQLDEARVAALDNFHTDVDALVAEYNKAVDDASKTSF